MADQPRSIGLHVTVDGNQGERLLNLAAGRRVQARIRITPDHHLDLMVVDTGEWRVAEVASDGSAPPRIMARGRLPSSYRDEDRRGSFH
jgi:hypothetical protein